MWRNERDERLARRVGLQDWDSTLEILTAVDGIEEALRASTEESERTARLPEAAMQAIVDTGAIHMRLPAEFGGPDLSIVGQMLVLGRLAEADSASSWCTMVSSGALGRLAIYLSSEGVDRMFGSDPRTVIAAGVAAATGRATRVDGGLVVEGSWRFCSNIHNADWVRCNALIDGDPDQEIAVVVPKGDVRIIDTWTVVGLRGTGSNDFALDGVFVPDAMTIDIRTRRQLRGARDYDKADGLLATYEHAAFAIGLGRRALNAFETYVRSARLKDREVVAAELSRLTLEFEAAVLLTLDAFAGVEETSAEEETAESKSRLKAIAAYVTEVAAECANRAFLRAGGKALYLPNELDAVFRDIAAARAHVLVSDQNYVGHGTELLARVRARVPESV